MQMAKSVDPNEKIVVVSYDPAWADEFAQEREKIAGALGDAFVELDHIGSTAVPGLSAKPIIDLQMTVESMEEAEQLIQPLEALGYVYKPQDDKWHLFLSKGSPRTHHLHIVLHGSWDHRRHVLYRDYLREHPEVADQYDELKRKLAEKFADDRAAYTDAKTAFVEAVVKKAMEKDEQKDG
jgi:GrpB-like predicted nucleotidyltransferase (UPF0157 family)